MNYDDFLREVSPRLDLAWRKYRRRSARRRVESRILELGLSGYSEFLARVLEDPEEAGSLPDRMRVTVSRFLRERPRWEQLAAAVLPELVATRRKTGRLRVWSAGCCGGEEPYTLAIVLLDQWGVERAASAAEILATDIDGTGLERARRGVYDAGSLREVPRDVLSRWFAPAGAGWRVDPRAAGLVRFSYHNLVKDPPPRDRDLVLCRYLAFTYYRGERRYRAAENLWQSLRPGGALVIGRKEGPGPRELELFEPWPGAEGVFRKR